MDGWQFTTADGQEMNMTVVSSFSAYWPWGLGAPAVLVQAEPRKRAWLGVRTARIRLPYGLARHLTT